MEMSKTANKLAITSLVESISKKYSGIGTSEDVENLVSLPKVWIDTKIPKLNAVLGHGIKGLPCGKITELFGAESHGKTSLLYYLLGQCQAQGGVGILIDSELSFDPKWASLMGVKPEELILVTRDAEFSIEKSFDIMTELSFDIRNTLGRDIPILIGYDTIWCTPTVEEIESTRKSYTGTRRLGTLARCLSKCLPTFTVLVTELDLCVMIVNQVRDNIGSPHGGISTPGGRALKHMCSVRVRVRRVSRTDAGNIVSLATNIKNKIDKPFQEQHFKIDQRKGIVPYVKREQK